jgi:uncharacterized protein (UPF0335 family)
MSEIEAAGRIRSIIERAERLLEEKQTIADDLKELFAEAKAEGFNVPVLKKIIKDRAKDPNDISEFEAIEALYLNALQGSLDLQVAA